MGQSLKLRQAEGIVLAKTKGVRFGRKPIELPEEFDEVSNKFLGGEITVREGARELSMAPTTFYKKSMEKKNKFK